ncbi:hypothetical protein QUF76_07385, partial [Desulfobacterales bacterium HSG16]|nr:hypothetical protein [Desulfobacterales bacterium HSG16]
SRSSHRLPHSCAGYGKVSVERGNNKFELCYSDGNMDVCWVSNKKGNINFIATEPSEILIWKESWHILLKKYSNSDIIKKIQDNCSTI